MKVKTQHVFPPIPIRTVDWCAFYEGHEESGQYGWGKTEVEAIADLKLSYPEEILYAK